MVRLAGVLALTVLLVGFGAALADKDDEFTSENMATTVRPPRPREVKRQPQKKDDKGKSSKSETFSAEEIEKLKEQDGKTVTVRGKVVSTFAPKSGAVFILNFGKDHRKCFKVAIFKRNFEKWEGGTDAIKKQYEGKTIAVEGKLQIHEGLPEIIVNVPSQIKVVTDKASE